MCSSTLRPCLEAHQASPRENPAGPAVWGALGPGPQAAPGELRTRCPHSLGIPGPATAAPLTACFPLSGGKGRPTPTSCPTESDHLGHQGPLKNYGLAPTWGTFPGLSDPKCQPSGFLVVSNPSDLGTVPRLPVHEAGDGPLYGLLTTPPIPQRAQSLLPNLLLLSLFMGWP